MSYKLVCFYDIERDKFLCAQVRESDQHKIFFWARYEDQANDKRYNIFWILIGSLLTMDDLINDKMNYSVNSRIASEIITKLKDRRDSIIMVEEDGDGGFDFLGDVS
jgi:hypothetical protein